MSAVNESLRLLLAMGDVSRRCAEMAAVLRARVDVTNAETSMSVKRDQELDWLADEWPPQTGHGFRVEWYVGAEFADSWGASLCIEAAWHGKKISVESTVSKIERYVTESITFTERAFDDWDELPEALRFAADETANRLTEGIEALIAVPSTWPAKAAPTKAKRFERPSFRKRRDESG